MQIRKRLRFEWARRKTRRACKAADRSIGRLRAKALVFAESGPDTPMRDYGDVLVLGAKASKAGMVAEEQIRNLTVVAELYNAESAGWVLKSLGATREGLEIVESMVKLLRSHYKDRQAELAVLMATWSMENKEKEEVQT